ncbi:hypothetical protein Rsub_09784 [Raphidocelis subcapitata]|uniref:HMG box domain-containing protein n=1 Tax=Raphidocelis subcapitata TaxID=307507 RepID=A0A2V0PI80_9CHLO|nr:hypothetical protein Rsub_09784 [Raphidocelis subcapitata]|eukprot:GBF96987.1 hypothetical protein Rsub_09784 [Raphidocelis subcapitata]
MAPKKAPTAYFLYADANRATVHKELVAAAAAAAAAAAGEEQQQDGDGGGAAAAAEAKPKAVSVALVAKELGVRWRALTAEEKAGWVQAAKQRAEELAAAAAEAGPDAADGAAADADADAAGEGEDQEQQLGPALPRGVVKRIMACDPEFKRASADAVWLISAAAEALLGLVAERAARQALSRRRRTVKLEDMQHVIKYDRRLVEAGLKDVVEDASMYDAAAAAAAAKAAGRAKPAKAAADGDGGDGGGGNGGGDGGSPGGEADGGQQQQAKRQAPAGQRGRNKRAQEEVKGQRKLDAFFTAA